MLEVTHLCHGVTGILWVEKCGMQIKEVISKIVSVQTTAIVIGAIFPIFEN